MEKESVSIKNCLACPFAVKCPCSFQQYYRGFCPKQVFQPKDPFLFISRGAVLELGLIYLN